MHLAIGIPGGAEWLVILFIVIIFFGVGKLPKVLGQMGKGVKAFKDGMNSEDDDDDGLPKELVTEASFAEAEEVSKTKTQT